ncbi:hypothetical protein C8Q76DRAFT_717733 [Earliella scabrosa]|nr:hypothetical protein C8Q76DRAFT_717733 [Earliella scabrosa]
MTTTTTFAQPPFNNPAGDFVIRSRDGVHFRIRSDILAEASPVLVNTFRITQQHAGDSSQSVIDAKPVIPMSEDSETLDPLLRLAYPTADPVFSSLRDVRLVLEAAIKYQMEEAIALLKKTLRLHIKDQPLRVWAIACLLRLDEEAKAAAAAMLESGIPVEPPKELRKITAGDVYRLAVFHEKRGDVPESFCFWDPDPASIADAHTQEKKASRYSRTRAITYCARPYGDIICRSSDGSDFVSHRIILTMASPVLADQIARLSETHVGVPPSSLPVLEMAAPASILSPVLELCYGTECSMTADLGGLRAAVDMMVCAREYKLEHVFEKLSRHFRWYSNDRPLSRYLLSSTKGLNDVAAGVLQSLRGDLLAHGYVPEMESTSGNIYHTLLINRRQSIAAASKVVNAVVPPPSTAPSPTMSTTSITASVSEPGTPPATRKAKAGPAKPARAPATPAPQVVYANAWVVGLFRQTAEGLRNLTGGMSLSQLMPDIPALLTESLKKKIWCQQCEPNVRLMVEMKRMHREVSNRVWEHDRLKS